MPRLPPRATRDALDAAVAAGADPFQSGGGQQGLLVRPPGRRAIRLFTDAGALNDAGTYYFQKRAVAPPDRGFDPNQEPVLHRRREQIMLRDGSMGTLRTFDGKQWRFTKLGQSYYAERRVKFLAYLPVFFRYFRKDGRTQDSEPDTLPSTATDLGEVHVPANLPDSEQTAEARRQVLDFVKGLVPTPTGEYILAEESGVLTILAADFPEGLTLNRETVSRSADGAMAVRAVMLRPLQEAKPWLFADTFKPHAMCDAAFEATEGRCVSHQLQLMAKRRQLPVWTPKELEDDLEDAYQALYASLGLESPYALEDESGRVTNLLWQEHGCTAEMIVHVCRKRQVPLHAVWHGCLIQSFKPAAYDHHVDSVALCVAGNHAYFYGDAKTKELVSRMEVKAPGIRSPVAVAVEGAPHHIQKVPPASEWQELPLSPWQEGEALALEPNKHYWALAEDIDRVRLALHKQQNCPRVRLGGPTRIVGLTVAFGRKKGDGRAYVHAMPHNHEACELFCRRMQAHLLRDFAYRGESSEVLTQRALEELMRPPKRSYIKTSEETAILRAQDFACASCGDKLPRKGFHLDHVIARHLGGSDAAQNMQALCGQCHVGKSYAENVSSVEEENILVSRFNRETYEAFHLSAKPPQMVANLHEHIPARGAVVNVDIRRCRFNGLVQNEHPLPVFAPTDEIKAAVPGELGDYNWVHNPQARHPQLCAPYFGAGFYGRASCEYMLSRGIIKWSHVELSFTAAAHLPPAYLRERLQLLDKLWEEAVDRDAAKWAGNALIGLWSKLRRFRYNLCTTTDVEDVLYTGCHAKRPTPGGDGVYVDVVVKIEQLSYRSMRPIQQFALEHERLNVARMLYINRKLCEPKFCLSVVTDGVFLQPGPRAAKKMKEVYDALRYCDLHQLRERFEGQQPELKFFGRDGPVVRETPHTSQELVYKCALTDPQGRPIEARMPGGELTIQDGDRPNLPELEWQVLPEPVDGPDDFYATTVRPHVVEGQRSALFEAPPGYGKTHLLKRLEADLRAAGHEVQKIALCHVAARNLGPGAMTIHAFCHRHVLHSTFKGWVLLDEISMVPLQLAACLEHLHLAGCKIACFGDRLQLEPVEPTWRGRPVPADALMNSRLLKLWCDCTLFQLTRYRRGTDHDFCQWFRCARHMELKVAVIEAIARFPAKPGSVDWNLCLSHNRRRKINAECQAAAVAAYRGRCPDGLVVCLKPPEAPQPELNEAQEYDIFEGTKLIGCNSEHAAIVNGALLTVTGLTEQKAQLVDDETQESFEIGLQALQRHTRLRHAITIAACQGRTLQGSVRLWDVESPYFRQVHLYVAASRCTHGDLLQVMPRQPGWVRKG